MKKVLLEHKDQYLSFYCKGCEAIHQIRVASNPVMYFWEWNGSIERPTITPSIMVNGDLSHPARPRCHSYVTDGKIQYLSDCTHSLAGQTVELEDIK